MNLHGTLQKMRCVEKPQQCSGNEPSTQCTGVQSSQSWWTIFVKLAEARPPINRHLRREISNFEFRPAKPWDTFNNANFENTKSHSRIKRSTCQLDFLPRSIVRYLSKLHTIRPTRTPATTRGLVQGRASRREKVETLRQRTAVTIEISRREGPLSNQRSPTGIDEGRFMCLGPHNGNMVAGAFDLIRGCLWL